AVHRHMDGEDALRVALVRAASRAHGVPIVATNAVRYALREEKPIDDVLYCIREGVTLDEAGRRLSPNAEAHLKAPDEMERLFADQPAWIERSRAIADRCRSAMTELAYRFPSELEDALPGEDANAMLRRKTYEGAKTRYPDPGGLPEKVRAQIEKEL